MSNFKGDMKLRRFAELSKEEVWIKYLKPELEKIKKEKSESESSAVSGFEAIRNDIERVTTNRIINRIIRLIDNSSNKLISK